MQFLLIGISIYVLILWNLIDFFINKKIHNFILNEISIQLNRTSLLKALRRGNVEIIKLLLENEKLDINRALKIKSLFFPIKFHLFCFKFRM